jgi:hypothetical protein
MYDQERTPSFFNTNDKPFLLARLCVTGYEPHRLCVSLNSRLESTKEEEEEVFSGCESRALVATRLE